MFADDNFILDENGRRFSKRVENTVGKLLVTSNLFFSVSVFKRLVLQTLKIQGLFQIGLKRNDFTFQLCRETANYYLEASCPGICGRLSSCLECLSQGQGAVLTDKSPQRRTYIQPCNWCVKEAKCQQRSSMGILDTFLFYCLSVRLSFSWKLNIFL